MDLVAKILEFSSVSERLKLARGSTRLLHLITRDCTSLWVEIDFSKEERAQRERLCDAMLAGVLTRVSAREVTKYLNLWGCVRIEGSGLSPLRSSRMIERLDLRTDPQHVRWRARFLDESETVAILRTMIPRNLWDVRFLGNHMERPTIQQIIYDF